MTYDVHAESGDLVACILGFRNRLAYQTTALQAAIDTFAKLCGKVLNTLSYIG